MPAVDGVVRWRLVDLVQWVWETFGISISRQTLGRELRAMGYRKLSARPRHHAQAAGAVEAFQKVLPKDRAPGRGVAVRPRLIRVDQAATPGSLMMGSLLMGARLSRLM